MIDTAFTLEDEDLINIEDVTARIAYLEERDCHHRGRDDYPCPATFDCATCDQSAEDELMALRDLEEDMRPAREYAGRASAIRESYLDDFVRAEIDDVVGDGLSIVDEYIDWERLVRDRAGEMTETTFLRTTYYITS